MSEGRYADEFDGLLGRGPCFSIDDLFLIRVHISSIVHHRAVMDYEGVFIVEGVGAEGVWSCRAHMTHFQSKLKC